MECTLCGKDEIKFIIRKNYKSPGIAVCTECANKHKKNGGRAFPVSLKMKDK